jgi:hypothetical protein
LVRFQYSDHERKDPLGDAELKVGGGAGEVALHPHLLSLTSAGCR